MIEVTQTNVSDLNNILKRPTDEIKFVEPITPAPFGPSYMAGPDNDMGTAVITGEGRQSTITGPGPFFDCENQGSWHDGSMHRMAFQGQAGSPNPLVNLSGYSLSLRDIFIRGQTNGIGLRLFGGQDAVLDMVQTEGCNTGIHIDDYSQCSIQHVNVESCAAGLVISRTYQTKGRNIVIGQVYAEATKEAMVINNCSGVILAGGVYCSDRTVNHAVMLHNSSDCVLNLSDSSGLVYIGPSSHNNLVIVNHGSETRVDDQGFNNTIQTAQDPVAGFAQGAPWVSQEIPNDNYIRFDRVFENVSQGSFTFQYKTTKQADLNVELYDYDSGEFYDFATRAWTTSGKWTLPWITNQVCEAEIPFVTTTPRKIQFRVICTRGAGSILTIWDPIVC